MTSYYAASGYPPGHWFGTGLAGLDAGRGLAAGTTVGEEAMAALFGRGHDPVSGAALGRAYPTYRTAEERIADAVALLPDTLDEAERQAAVAGIERREQARPVAGGGGRVRPDLHRPEVGQRPVGWATPPQRAMAEAHREAVQAVLELVEGRFPHTLGGANSCAQVDTRGMVAAGFDHWDTRTGDPVTGSVRGNPVVRGRPP